MLYQILEDGDQYGLMLCGFSTEDEAKTYFKDKIEQNNKREELIHYEMKMRSCSDEVAEQMVDSYLASTTV